MGNQDKSPGQRALMQVTATTDAAVHEMSMRCGGPWDLCPCPGRAPIETM